ncbi:uncharacterized protein LOC143941240 [Lithobates pipiens]
MATVSQRFKPVVNMYLVLKGACFLASIDIKDAYLHIPIFPAHQKCLHFEIENHNFQFVALPCGLATAPRVFSKILAPPLARLRAHGITVQAYLDDLLLIDHSVSGLNQSLITAVTYLEILLKTIKEITVLGSGHRYHTEKGILTPDKSYRTDSTCQSKEKFFHSAVHEIVRVNGGLHRDHPLGAVSLTLLLQNTILSVWKKKVQALDFPIRLSPDVCQSLNWWLISSNLQKGKSFLLVSWKEATTDASLLGWGAVLEEDSVQGRWSKSERALPINILEIRAVRLALDSWTLRLRDCPVRIQSDNATAVAYINHQGGTRSRAAQKEVNRVLA